jgi:penicillin-binding protein 1A
MPRGIRTLFDALLLAAGLAAAGLGLLFFAAVQDLPRVPEPLGRIIDTPPTEIYAASGERILVVGDREAVPLSRVAPDFLRAVVATEDHRFWDHHGVDKVRLIKAFWVTFFRPGRVEGASTITQQLAKNLFFSFERSYWRKFRELLVALQIESRFDKDEILEAYVNQIPFAPRAHGIEQAARHFFAKSAADLDLAEAALLAGLPKSPTRYNPYRHLDRAKQRQGIVLKRLVATGYATPEAAAQAFQQPLQLRTEPARAETGSYFLDTVLKDLEQRYGTDVVHQGGLRVSTTLDPRLQRLADAAMAEGLVNLDRVLGLPGDATEPDDRPQGALVALETRTGAVRALVGGRDYRQTTFNRALQNNRQPGSGFKPFLYYTALEKLNLSPATLVVDRPVRIPIAGAPDWTPRNFERTHRGPVALKYALMKSINTVAAQLVESTGPGPVIDTARRCGITSPLADVYSVALGTSGVSPLEMAAAFATFADGGVRHPPFWIARVEDSSGRVLEEHIVGGRQSLDPLLAYQVLDMLQGVVDEGSGAVVRRMDFEGPAAGKTGTTNDYQDAWFTGFTPTLCASVWVGFDQGRPLLDGRGQGITGGRGAAPIWTAFMRQATAGDPPREFNLPEGLRVETVDPATGRAPDELTREVITVAVKADHAPGGLFTTPEATAAPLTFPVAPPPAAGAPPANRILEEDLPPDH